MILHRWLGGSSRRASRRRQAPRAHVLGAGARVALWIETLEDRLLPSLTPHLLRDIFPGASSSITVTTVPQSIPTVNGIVYFPADDGVHGLELWKSDGTSAGTTMVKDINPGSGNSFPTSLTNFNGTLFFAANDGVHGKELWRSNGTAVGTVLVKNPHRPGIAPALGLRAGGDDRIVPQTALSNRRCERCCSSLELSGGRHAGNPP